MTGPGRRTGLAVALWCAGLAAPATAADEWYVDARHGSDQAGQGTLEAPWRSVTRALQVLADHDSVGVLQLAYGEYTTETGEEFPLRVPAGVTLRGLGAAASVLKGGEGTDALVKVLPGDGAMVLESVGLTGAARGVVLEAHPGKVLTAHLVAVDFHGLDTGLDLVCPDPSGQPGPDVQARLLRCTFRGGDRGVVLRGAGRMHLDGQALEFRELRRGIDLDARTGGHGTWQQVYLQDCWFGLCRESGLHREGPDGPAPGSPGLILVGCAFRGNDQGIHLAQPGGDVPLHVADCSFAANASFGLRATGGLAEAQGRAILEHCEFDRNGVALHLTGLGQPWEVQRCRISGSVGNGVLLGTFQGQESSIRIRDTQIDDNAGAGLFLISDVRRMAIQVEHCTVVRNGGGGVRRKDRHGGATSLMVWQSILWDNRLDGAPADAVNLAAGDLRECLISDGQFVDGDGNFAADPGFVDVGFRDFRLARGSPGRREAGDEGVVDPLVQDRDGCVRDPARPVLGAHCCPPPHR